MASYAVSHTQYTSHRSPSSSSSSFKLMGKPFPSAINARTASTGTSRVLSTASAARSSHFCPTRSRRYTFAPSASGASPSRPGTIMPDATPVSRRRVKTLSVGNTEESAAETVKSRSVSKTPSASAGASVFSARARHDAPQTSLSRMGSSGSDGSCSSSIASALLSPASIWRAGDGLVASASTAAASSYAAFAAFAAAASASSSSDACSGAFLRRATGRGAGDSFSFSFSFSVSGAAGASAAPTDASGEASSAGTGRGSAFGSGGSALGSAFGSAGSAGSGAGAATAPSAASASATGAAFSSSFRSGAAAASAAAAGSAGSGASSFGASSRGVSASTAVGSSSSSCSMAAAAAAATTLCCSSKPDPSVSSCTSCCLLSAT